MQRPPILYIESNRADTYLKNKTAGKVTWQNERTGKKNSAAYCFYQTAFAVYVLIHF